MFLERIDVASDSCKTALTVVLHGIVMGLTAGITQLKSRVEPVRQLYVCRNLVVLHLPVIQARRQYRREDVELHLRTAVHRDRVGGQPLSGSPHKGEG